ncbi:MAG: L-threonylcarbamoyladenylate synthase [Acidimicrobiales bacterium]|nr:threonylcarbamoyl-AMP synthase [Actinomycetes bacterium]MDP6286956.1 L-threonylcarbamoyladenylate synthase [Acidimicrobiales bacterium]HCW00954.1 threonylcarbamoyl-AMP synthase [Acidimicrobiaceae bacterium]MDP6911020.1 L-threonylcarbamoyladenylate synthase [Acidimicrobiales bacterium]HJM72232.1 L-threonylcarbamoyladenylate synthase [Acidimicrobiales bacterium]
MILDVSTDPAGAVDAAVACLRAGGVVVLPTETVYGVAALADDSSAVAELFVRKGRPTDRRVAVLVADLDQARSLAVVDERTIALAEVAWPGPLTMVLPTVPGSDEATVGVRCPDHALVQAVATSVGPIATTSANRSGDPTPADAASAAASLGGDLLVLDGGRCTGMPSTVVDLTVDPAVILREGTVTVADLEAAGIRVEPGSAGPGDDR